MVMRALILGSSGQLGWQCMRDLPAYGVSVRGVDRRVLDVSKGNASDWLQRLQRELEAFKPHWVVNALAYTAVDRAEDEPSLARQVNGEFPGVLAQAVERFLPGCRLLHCSTDYVFDGSSSEAYRESDQTNPLSVYGQSKLLGEDAVLAHTDRSWVLRFSWVVGEHGQNFAKTMIRLACERDQLRVVGDQYGVPSPTTFLVREFVRLMRHPQIEELASQNRARRRFHVVPSGETDWHRYAQLCVGAAQDNAVLKTKLKATPDDVVRIETKDYPTKARRPQNARLNCDAWCALHQMPSLPDWLQETRTILKSIINHSQSA